MALDNKTAFATLADVKSDLGITDATHDANLERRILAASALIERYCNRPFRRQTGRIEKLAGFGTTRLLPALTPIITVTSLTFDGAIVDPSVYELETDEVRGESWALYAEDGWYWTAPGAQTMAEKMAPLPGMERKAFTLTYTGGYGLPNDSPASSDPQIPGEIREACTLLAAHMHRQRGRDGNVVAESEGSASIQLGTGEDSAASFNGIPPQIAAMLDGFKRAT